MDARAKVIIFDTSNSITALLGMVGLGRVLVGFALKDHEDVLIIDGIFIWSWGINKFSLVEVDRNYEWKSIDCEYLMQDR